MNVIENSSIMDWVILVILALDNYVLCRRLERLEREMKK